MSPPSAERVTTGRKIFAAAAIAITIALAACNTTSSPEASPQAPLAYEPPAPVTRVPLSPPAGYASATTSSLSGGGDEAARLGWHASPRWTVIKGNGMLVENDNSRAASKADHARFEAAKAKAEGIGVENLSDKDVEGLTQAQLRELRGY